MPISYYFEVAHLYIVDIFTKYPIRGPTGLDIFSPSYFFLQRIHRYSPCFSVSLNLHDMLSFLTVNIIIALAYVAVNLLASASASTSNLIILPRNIARDMTPLLPFDSDTIK